MITIDNRRVAFTVVVLIWAGFLLAIAPKGELGGMTTAVLGVLGIVVPAVLGADAYDIRQRRLDPSTLASQIAAANGVVVAPDHGKPPEGDTP